MNIVSFLLFLCVSAHFALGQSASMSAHNIKLGAKNPLKTHIDTHVRAQSAVNVLKAPVKKPELKKAPVKKPELKKAPAKKAPLKKAPAKKAPLKKAPAKKAPLKKAPAKKAPLKKAPAKKPELKKAPAKKPELKKAPLKKAPVKKSPVKKSGLKKAPVKKPELKKAPVKKSGLKKAPVKKPELKKAPVKKILKSSHVSSSSNEDSFGTAEVILSSLASLAVAIFGAHIYTRIKRKSVSPPPAGEEDAPEMVNLLKSEEHINF